MGVGQGRAPVPEEVWGPKLEVGEEGVISGGGEGWRSRLVERWGQHRKV